MTRGGRLLARGLLLVLLGLALAACRAAAPTAAPAGTAKFEPQWVGGKLQPMPDGFPRKALTIVTSETVGAGVDLFARAMAAAAEPYSPVGVKVDNVATPISGIGFMIYGKEQPDGTEGYWLSTIDVSGPIRAYTKDSKGYTMKDVVVLSPGNEDRYVYVVKADAPWKDLKDLAKYAKDNPGKVRVAGAEAGGLHHMLTEMYAKEAGIKLTYVPLGASAEAYRTVLGGGAEVAAGPSSSAFGFIQKGDLRALALFSDQRLPSLPDVFTTKEQGYNVEFTQFRVIATNRWVSPDRMAWLSALFTKAYESDSFKKFTQTSGSEFWDKTPEQTNAWYATNIPKAEQILKDIGLHRGY